MIQEALEILLVILAQPQLIKAPILSNASKEKTVSGRATRNS